MQLLYLLSYSPDLNPIKEGFLAIKAWLCYNCDYVLSETEGLGWDLLMSLPIRYLPMASYFRLSIIFLAPQILRHLLCQCDLFQLSCKPSCNHHGLYPIPIAPSVWYHIGDLPYDLWTTLLHFPFLVSSLLPDTFFHVPYALPHMDLVLILFIVCI